MNGKKRITKSFNKQEKTSQYQHGKKISDNAVNNSDTLQKMYARWNVVKLRDDVQSVKFPNDLNSNSLDSKSALPSRLNDIEEHLILNETVLYSKANETAFSLNSSAKAIWDLCDGKHTVLDISHTLGARFGFSSEELLSDVKATIDHLQKLHLLELKNVFHT